MAEFAGAVIGFVAEYAFVLFLISLSSLVVASVAGAWLIARLPADYFVAPSHTRTRQMHWVLSIFLFVVRNLIGILLVVAGIVMLFTPGQGVLTIVAGLLLADFPGKFALECRVARVPSVMKTLNWVRARHAQPPFVPPP